MAEVEQFAYGWATPVAAIVLSVSGCLLGILLTTAAPARRGRARLRLLLYAGVAVGMIGIWLPQVVVLSGVNASVVRYDAVMIGTSLGVALFAATAAVVVAGVGGPRLVRIVSAGALLGAGIAGSIAAGIGSVRAAGTVTIVPFGIVASVALALLAAAAGVWLVFAHRGLRVAILVAAVTGAAIWGTQAVAVASVRLTPAPDSPDTVTGINPIALLGVLVLGVAVDLMLWFFTVGSKTTEDLHAVFNEGRTIDIEPWIIQEVTARIAVNVTVPPGPEDRDRTLPLPTRRPPGPRPTPGITPVWKTMPVWGQANEPTAPVNRWNSTAAKAGAARSTVVVVAEPMPASLAAPNQAHEGDAKPAWLRNSGRH